MKLFLYRLSLTQNVQADIFEVIEGDGTTETRKDFLVRQFEKDFRFEYRKGIKLRYQHTQTDGDVIAGGICRWISEDVEGDPADPFALTGRRLHFSSTSVMISRFSRLSKTQELDFRSP